MKEFNLEEAKKYKYGIGTTIKNYMGGITMKGNKIYVGCFVRWHEFPDRLYYVKELGVKFCGCDDYVRIESIDHRNLGVVRECDLTIDE